MCGEGEVPIDMAWRVRSDFITPRGSHRRIWLATRDRRVHVALRVEGWHHGVCQD